MEIKNRFTSEVIFKSKHKTIKMTGVSAVEKGVDLSRANLSGVDLFRANLSGADLSGADLSRAILCDTKFEHTKISYRDKTVEVNFKEV